VEIDAGHRAAALADPARLRPQHAKSGARQPLGNPVEIRCTAPERRQQHDARPASLRQHLDRHIGAPDHDAGYGLLIHE